MTAKTKKVVDIKNPKGKSKVSSKTKEKAKEKTTTAKRDGKKEVKKTTAPVTEKEKNTVEFKRKSRIEKSKEERTIKYLYKNRDRLRFDLAIQRGEVWSLDQKSDLIHSILYGYPIPPVLVNETDDKFIWFLDGKQRLTSIIGFIKGDYSLSKKTKSVYGHDISGYKFKDLPEDMQDLIYDETITLIKLKNMTEDEVDTLFVKWNSGSTLSKIELTRAMHSDLIEQINHISDLEFFAEDVILTDKARNRFVDQEIILQIAMLLDDGRDNIKGFGSAQVKEYVLRLKTVDKVLSDELIKKFEDVSRYLNMSVSDFDTVARKKVLKKIHIPIIFNTAIKAMENKLKPYLFGEFIRAFLITNYSIESDYGRSCQSGSSKKENVQVRLHEMSMSFDEFLATLESHPENALKAIEEFEEKQKEEIEEQSKQTLDEEEKTTKV